MTQIATGFSRLTGNGNRLVPDYLAPLTDGNWGLWRWIGLRGAGFPAQMVIGLSDSLGVEQAERVLDAEKDLQQARREAKQAINAALDTLKASGGWADKEQRNALLNALRTIDRNERPKQVAMPGIEGAIGCFVASLDRVEMARQGYREGFADAADRVSAQLMQAARLDSFQEAIVWQNRQALHGSMSFLAEGPGENRGAGRRRREASIARYIQRYCTKNDTIGFFGPVGWARFTDRPEAVHVRPGPTLLKNRNVYFEGWAIEALAERLSQDEALRPWMAPRMMPFLHLQGDVLHIPMAGAVKVPPKQVAVLKACDGVRTAKEVARLILRSPSAGMTSENDVYQVLSLLARQRRISWAFDLPLDLEPEVHLAEQLMRIEDEELRSRHAAALGELLAARDSVAQAAGNAVELDRAMATLEETFVRLTGKEPTRRSGQTYAARTLVYEDCSRDLEVEFGLDLLNELDAPLSLLLASARWLTVEVAEVYRKILHNIYAELARKSGSASVSMAEFWLWGHDLFFNESSHHLESVRTEFQKRWASLLPFAAGDCRVQFDAASLGPAVQEAFDVPAPGWNGVRYHSPDIMIAAASEEALRAGDYQMVMGELHVGINTLGINAFLSQHPALEECIRALEQDLPRPRIVPVISRDWNITARTCMGLISPDDLRLLVSHDACRVPAGQALPVGSLVVESHGGELVVRTRDGMQTFGILDVVGEALLPAITDIFKLLPPGDHTPRITVDRLVVARETWRFPASQLAFVHERDEADRFLAARRWIREHGLPPRVFVRTPLEKKPFFVDFDSVILVENLSKGVRSVLEGGQETDLITLSEMLPSFDQLWLTDVNGDKYASELRIAAVDLTPTLRTEVGPHGMERDADRIPR